MFSSDLLYTGHSVNGGAHSLPTQSAASTPARRPPSSLHRRIQMELNSFPFKTATTFLDRGKYDSTTSICSATSHMSLPCVEDYVFNEKNPNYQKLMNDNHLLDTCCAAEQDMNSSIRSQCTANDEDVRQQREQQQVASDTGGSAEACATINIYQLEQWLVYMEKYLAIVTPSIAEVKRMSSFERKTRYQEQYELRQYIASYNSTINRVVELAGDGTNSDNGSSNIQQMANKYLALLLSSIESQCLLEGFPELYSKRAEPILANGGSSVDNVSHHVEDMDLCTDDIYKLCDIDLESNCSSTNMINADISNANNDPHSDYVSGDDPVGDEFPTPFGSRTSLMVNNPNLCDELLEVIGSQPASRDNQSLLRKLSSGDNLQCFITASGINANKVNRWLHWRQRNQVSESSDTSSSNDCNQCETDLSGIHQPNTAVSPSMLSSQNNQSTSGIGHSIGGSGEDSVLNSSYRSVEWDDFQEIYLSDMSFNSSVEQLERFLTADDDYETALQGAPSFNQSNEDFLSTSFSSSLDGTSLKSGDNNLLTIKLPANTESKKSFESSTESDQMSLDGCISPAKKLPKNIEQLAKPKKCLVAKVEGCGENELSELLLRKSNGKNMKLLNNRKYHIRKKGSSRFQRASHSDLFDVTHLLASNVHKLTPKDIDSIMQICRNNIGCLNAVLVGRSSDRNYCRGETWKNNDCSIEPVAVSTRNMDEARLEICSTECRCGVIACCVQHIIDFLLDFTNVFRNSRLYRSFVALLKELYCMVKFLSERTAYYRKVYNSIEFLL